MATRLPTVTVARIEAGTGFLITCTACPDIRTIRPSRPAADLYANDHRSSHVIPDPADQIDALNTPPTLINTPWSTR